MSSGSMGGGAQVPPPGRVPAFAAAGAPADPGRRAPVERVRRSVLPNGLRVLTDEHPERRSVSMSVWVAVGSRDEPGAVAGASHFLEHLLFKGTDTRDARSIALAVDSVGGEMNAFTASENTSFYAQVPDDAAPMALDILLDVVTSPALAAADVDAEREVILEELAAADDDPADVGAVALFEALFPGHPLGRETLGTEATVSAMSRDDVAGFFRRWYTPANLVVAAAGAVDHDGLVQAVADRLGDAEPGRVPSRAAPGATPGEDRFCRRPVELTQVALGWRAPSALDDRRHALALLNHVLGGSPSSRLFQTVREERGLTYSITSEVSQYVDGGALSINCSTLPRKVESVLGIIEEIVGEMAEDGITDEELARAKSAMRGGVQLGYESMWARMNRLGAAETVRGGVTPLAEHLEMIDEVGPGDVRAVAGAVLAGPRATSLVGPERP